MMKELQANETFDSTMEEHALDTDSAASPKRSKKVTYAIIGVSLLAVVAIVVGAVVGTRSGSNDKSTETNSDNVMSCDMEQMEPIAGQLFSMGPATMSITDDMMTMDSMMLNCVAEDEEPAVFMKMSSEIVTMASGATQITWHGAMVDSLGVATVVQSSDGTMSATFTTEDAAYSVMTDPNGVMQMKMTLWADFPNEEDAMASNTTSPTDAEIVAESFAVPFVMNGTVESEDKDVARIAVTGPGGRFLRHSRELQTSNVRVLLIVTNAAYCEFANLPAGCAFTASNVAPIEARIPLLQAEANDAMQAVGVSNVAIQIVSIVYVTFDSGPDEATLDTLASSQNVAQWREDAQADLVALITGTVPGGPICGRASGIFSVYSATRHDCLDQFSFTHELGHNFGARHDLDADPTSNPPFAHGHQDPNGQLRTMMATNCPNGFCPRIPFFSADGFTFQGIPIGSSTADNARLLGENGPLVAQFF